MLPDPAPRTRQVLRLALMHCKLLGLTNGVRAHGRPDLLPPPPGPGEGDHGHLRRTFPRDPRHAHRRRRVPGPVRPRAAVGGGGHAGSHAGGYVARRRRHRTGRGADAGGSAGSSAARLSWRRAEPWTRPRSGPTTCGSSRLPRPRTRPRRPRCCSVWCSRCVPVAVRPGGRPADLSDEGLTQAEIGDRLGISRQAVHQRLVAAQWSLDVAARPGGGAAARPSRRRGLRGGSAGSEHECRGRDHSGTLARVDRSRGLDSGYRHDRTVAGGPGEPPRSRRRARRAGAAGRGRARSWPRPPNPWPDHGAGSASFSAAPSSCSAEGRVTTCVLGLASAAGPTTARVQRDVLRGGAWIGVLERLALLGTLLAGWPEGLAAIIAVKGLARYPELRTLSGADTGAGERFIIGTFASLGWAAGVRLGADCPALTPPLRARCSHGAASAERAPVLTALPCRQPWRPGESPTADSAYPAAFGQARATLPSDDLVRVPRTSTSFASSRRPWS